MRGRLQTRRQKDQRDLAGPQQPEAARRLRMALAGLVRSEELHPEMEQAHPGFEAPFPASGLAGRPVWLSEQPPVPAQPQEREP